MFSQGADLDMYASVLCSMIVSLIFYGMNELAVEIENPFGWQRNDHDMTKFCKTLHRNCEQYSQKPGTLNTTGSNDEIKLQ